MDPSAGWLGVFERQSITLFDVAAPMRAGNVALDVATTARHGNDVIDLRGLCSECPTQFTRGVSATDVAAPAIAFQDGNRIDAAGIHAMLSRPFLALADPMVVPG
ncbi:hypothetical protein AYR46_03040 [Sphingobium yanoikuyae]|jgi:hypothetical protein|nr:hypothetical protein [Sphingobium yanoikuyae]KZC82895.1 hypothetical protein AYR46_03040 [Sphingobium yanoikuyae]